MPTCQQLRARTGASDVGRALTAHSLVFMPTRTGECNLVRAFHMALVVIPATMTRSSTDVQATGHPKPTPHSTYSPDKVDIGRNLGLHNTRGMTRATEVNRRSNACVWAALHDPLQVLPVFTLLGGAQGINIANKIHPTPGPRHRDTVSVDGAKEADITLVVRPHKRHNDDVVLVALKLVDGLHTHIVTALFHSCLALLVVGHIG
mmetsp:Transcript_42769/g.114460  ORF Transcript_42769/g.114460 Transcript_42769/m.114460 type:complete len:205 (+) Transcript_42769:1136-1750(+)